MRQRAWSRNKLRVLDLGRLGELAAKGFATPAQLADEAGRSGYDANRLEAVMALAQSYPGLAELDQMSNRQAIKATTTMVFAGPENGVRMKPTARSSTLSPPAR